MSKQVPFTLENGELKLDLDTLLGCFSDEQLRELAKTAIFEDALIEGVCKSLATGQIAWAGDESGNPWYMAIGGRASWLEDARRLFLPLIPTVIQQLVYGLIHERDRADVMSDRYRNALWELQRAWDEQNRPRGDVNYSTSSPITKEKAEEMIRALNLEFADQIKTEEEIEKIGEPKEADGA